MNYNVGEISLPQIGSSGGELWGLVYIKNNLFSKIIELSYYLTPVCRLKILESLLHNYLEKRLLQPMHMNFLLVLHV